MTATPKVRYTYVVLRYRHDSLAEEFANVGVVVHAPAVGFLDARMRHTLGRLSKIFPDLNGEDLKSSLRGIERTIKRMGTKEAGDLFGSFKNAGEFAKSAQPDDDSSFVWSALGSGLTFSPLETIEKLFGRFVTRYDEHQRGHRDDAAVWRPVRERLAERKLVDQLQPKTIASSLDRVEFEHASKNGAWHCYQPLSFDLANEETIRDKARRWTGHMVALNNAFEPFHTYFFVGLPQDQKLRAASQAAIKILELSPGNPRIVDETKIDEFVRQIEDNLRAHHHG
jgi:hypothetical protein